MYFYYGSFCFCFILILITSIAEIKVHLAYSKYKKIPTSKGIKANEFARKILDSANLKEINVVRTSGTLTDYYDNKNKTLALSEGVYDSSSVSALGIVAHEIGHALQYKEGYAPIKIKNKLYSIGNFISKFMWILLIIGLIGIIFIDTAPNEALNLYSYFILFFVIFYGFTTLMSLLTLPIEKDASKRALILLEETSTLNYDELTQTKEVLDAAALTYLASLIVSAMYFLRFLLIFIKIRDRD